MKVFTKVLALGVVGVGTAAVIAMLRRRAANRLPPIGGAMVVGEIDELEISAGPMNTDAPPLSQVAGEGYDPDVIPSAHPEINDLLQNMPGRTR
jgi:hypothetical protein